jgi:hypothetical protein
MHRIHHLGSLCPESSQGLGQQTTREHIKHNQKVSQSEILEKIIETTISDPEIMEKLFLSEPSTPAPPIKQVDIKIIARKKPDIRLFPDEWTD